MPDADFGWLPDSDGRYRWFSKSQAHYGQFDVIDFATFSARLAAVETLGMTVVEIHD